MDIQFFGANCFKLSTKAATIVIDDNLADLGLSSVIKAGEIALFTGEHKKPVVKTKIVIDYPGEYEVSGVSILGVPVRGHMEEEGKHGVTFYRLIIGDMRVAVLGHMYPDLTEDDLEALGTVDVLLIPVGGNGYTLDATGALKLIRKIEPKIVIPSHYADAKVNYAVPQQDLETALKNMAMEPAEKVAGKFKLKPTDFTDTTRLIVVERS